MNLIFGMILRWPVVAIGGGLLFLVILVLIVRSLLGQKRAGGNAVNGGIDKKPAPSPELTLTGSTSTISLDEIVEETPEPEVAASPPPPPSPARAGLEPESEGFASPDEMKMTATERKPAPVDFSIFAPGMLPPQTTQIIDVWAYEAEQFDEVREMAAEMDQTNLAGRKSGVMVARGSRVVVRLSIPSLGVTNEIDDLVWNGVPTNTSFAVVIPADAYIGSHPGTVTISVSGVNLARIRFSIQVGYAISLAPKHSKLPVDVTRIQKAFASYACEDRSEVLGRLQGMKKVSPDLDIFVDSLNIESGEDWSDRLESEITSRDVLYLFWSEHAAKSEWVEKEWRLALAKRGLDYIDPVPLQTPKVAPPPADLAELHFGDAYATYAYLEKYS